MTVSLPATNFPGAREWFSLDRGLAFLNHGSMGAVPLPVQRAHRRLLDEDELDPRTFHHAATDRLRLTREAVCPLIKAPVERTTFVPNTTTGVAVVFNSFDWRPGDEILSTNHRYPSIAFNIAGTARRHGLVDTVVTLPLTPTDEEVVETVLAGVTERTRLVVIDEITSATARLFPVAALAARLRRHGVPLLVDAAHVPGHLPVDVEAHGADFWVGNLHKWAFAPRGTAVMAVSAEWADRVRPLQHSYGDADGFPSNIEFHGTASYCGWIAAADGARFLEELGPDEVRAHNAQLAHWGQRQIAEALGVTVEDPGESPLAMRLLPLPGGVVSSQDGADALWRTLRTELRTEVSVIHWEGQGLLRIAAQVYNRPAEYQRLAEGLRELVRR